ncbi:MULTISPECIES: cation:proton antiporter [unclassified Streptomyces]|uniref:cation:proton antiporter n=1 Tax=unclassified Streptomyces TaxID=2593676 RepID=UPI0036EB0DC4
MTVTETARLLAGLGLICVVAHGCGHLFARLKQPPVIGEIVGGILLGPSLLGLFAPEAGQWLFPTSGPVSSAVDVVYQLGQLLLMFLAGAELHLRVDRRQRRTGVLVGAAGLLAPFAVGALIAAARPAWFTGPSGTTVTTVLVVGLAMSVAAIPVISRIMMDLGILDAPFGRIVLAVAVIEDVILYVVLAIALGLANSGEATGLWPAVGSSAVVPSVAYYTVVSALFFALALFAGPRVFRRLAQHRWNLVARQSPLAFRLVFLFGVVLCCMGFGINAVFGALVAGMCAVRGDLATGEATADAHGQQVWGAIRQFSMAFFVPVFFALVGVRLDLARSFDAWFFLWFLVVACAVKAVSIWGAALLAGESRAVAGSLAAALNARGTVGVVLAGLTYRAELINERFFVVLVLVSLVTSQLAGAVLARTAPKLRSSRETGPVQVEVG